MKFIQAKPMTSIFKNISALRYLIYQANSWSPRRLNIEGIVNQYIGMIATIIWSRGCDDFKTLHSSSQVPWEHCNWLTTTKKL